MKKIINFDSKYKQEIISGKYSLITRDRRTATIDVWDDNDESPLAVMVWKDYQNAADGNMFFYLPNGCYNKNKKEHRLDLFIVTDEESCLTEFESHVQKLMGPNVISDDEVKKEAGKLLALARKQ
jgi:hypothetical protein